LIDKRAQEGEMQKNLDVNDVSESTLGWKTKGRPIKREGLGRKHDWRLGYLSCDQPMKVK
jgi:hypothetical protein